MWLIARSQWAPPLFGNFSTFVRTMSTKVHTVAQVGFATGTNELYDR